jgi:hypothetical protein
LLDIFLWHEALKRLGKHIPAEVNASIDWGSGVFCGGSPRLYNEDLR